ncbi:hypothetical protein COT97_03415 [Candidatus Falkowbacteria bacterium CG10_big_fil_rev_8_21_14_0_10_39_11]|uniref:Transcription regulator TrmB N-terminal domain-containing protein n=1 Tax=Candidatus Falkowbacteria bacterium CG10_big_fil_rev_8_21_14_0_10_39_11 TaxID=1974565 RepID=A0A2H0V4J8_9BACT|nr:MAG: hypothetical protein COT97_03415 [Candidatus Falkowbacteria bacterium CG10_big_fil_rev_8_21_14_0_10_39_11]
MVVEQLLTIGLSQGESEVYLASLQLGYASVQQIADKAVINRTTAYSYIKNLIAKGLISTEEKVGKQYFIAEKPERLKYFWKKQEEEVKRRKESLDNIMPELESLYNLASGRPSVKLYDINQLDLARDYIVKKRSNNLFNIFNYEHYKGFISKAHVSSLIDSTLNFKALYIAENKVLDRKLHDFIGEDKFALKYLPYNRFNALCEILIADDEIYISRESEMLIINDVVFAKTLQILFHSMWEWAEDF